MSKRKFLASLNQEMKAKDIFSVENLLKITRNRDKLRSHLNGCVEVRISDTGESFFVDWMSERILVDKTPKQAPACTLSLSEQDLSRINNGDLNPQIAMLSDKIEILGDTSFASYFFNLLAPTHND